MAHTIVPVKTYLWVTAALMVLLVATVGVAYIPLGVWGVVVALIIATTKAALVMLYFMHVRFSSPLMRMFAVAGIVWLGILIIGTLHDYLTRLGPPFI